MPPETRAKRPPLATGEGQSGQRRQGVARLIDREAAGLIETGACAPRVTRRRHRLARVEEQRQALAEDAAVHGALPLLSGRLEDGAAKLHAGVEAAAWTRKRDLIRALVTRVEVARDDVTSVLRIDPYPGDADPEKKSWQLCRGSADSSLWRARVRWREEADFDNPCLQPLAQCSGQYGQLGQPWSIWSQQPLMSASSTHWLQSLRCIVVWMASMASIVQRPGRKP